MLRIENPSNNHQLCSSAESFFNHYLAAKIQTRWDEEQACGFCIASDCSPHCREKLMIPQTWHLPAESLLSVVNATTWTLWAYTSMHPRKWALTNEFQDDCFNCSAKKKRNCNNLAGAIWRTYLCYLQKKRWLSVCGRRNSSENKTRSFQSRWLWGVAVPNMKGSRTSLCQFSGRNSLLAKSQKDGGSSARRVECDPFSFAKW